MDFRLDLPIVTSADSHEFPKVEARGSHIFILTKRTPCGTLLIPANSDPQSCVKNIEKIDQVKKKPKPQVKY